MHPHLRSAPFLLSFVVQRLVLVRQFLATSYDFVTGCNVLLSLLGGRLGGRSGGGVVLGRICGGSSTRGLLGLGL